MRTFLFLTLLPALAFGGEPELERYATKLQAEWERLSQVALINPRPLNVPMNFGFFPPSEKIGGHCGLDGITIAKEEWVGQTDAQHEMLMFHELGHCALNRKDLNGTITLNGKEIPKSLMADTSFPEEFYLANRDYYLKELLFNETR